MLPDHLFQSPKPRSFHNPLALFLYRIDRFHLQSSIHLCSPATSSVCPVKMRESGTSAMGVSTAFSEA